MKPVLQILAFALVFALGAVAAVASGRLAGWFAAPVEANPASAVSRATVPTTLEASRCLDESHVRSVIREELAAATAASTGAPGFPGPGPNNAAPAPATAHQVEIVDQQLDQYIDAGVISDSEMTRLQAEIAGLEPAARRAALQKLVRALNSGALDGNL